MVKSLSKAGFPVSTAKASAAILAVFWVSLSLIGVGGCMGKKDGDAVGAIVTQSLQRLTEAARQIAEADYRGHYDRSHGSFAFRSGPQDEAPKTVAESDLAAFVHAATATAPRFVILYEAGDFPVLADKSAFEARVRTTIEAAGGTVIFIVSSPAPARLP